MRTATPFDRSFELLRQRIAAKPLPWFLLMAAVFLYFRLFIPPFTPILTGGDQDIFLVNATRMLAGEIIYKDFFQLTPPGTTLVYFVLFKIFGVAAWIPNASLIVVGVALTWLTVRLSSKVLQGKAAFLPGLVFLTFVYGTMLNGTHHWHSALAVAAALLSIIEKRTPERLALAGMFLGVASFFTQTRGLITLLGFTVFLVWEQKRDGDNRFTLLKKEISLLITFVCTLIAVDAYFIWEAGLGRFLYCQFTFVSKYIPSVPSWDYYLLGLPPVPPWHNLAKLGIFLFVHLLLPLVYLLFLVRYYQEARSSSNDSWAGLMLINFTGLFLFLEVAPSPTWFRLYSASLPALILVVWLARSPTGLQRVFLRVLWIAGLALAIGQPLWTQRHWRAYLDLPVGRTALLDKEAREKLQWLSQRTRPGEFFLQGAWPGVHFPLGLRNPAFMDFLEPSEYTRPEQVQRVIAALGKNHVRYVLWSIRLDLPDNRRPQGDHLEPIRAYLRQHYRIVKTFPDFDQVWERTID